MKPEKIDIASYFNEDEVEEIARECGFVQRKSPVTGMRFLLTFTTGLLNTQDGTLAQLAVFLGSTCEASVSPQAIDNRIKPLAMDFLAECLRRAFKLSAAIPRTSSDYLEQFDHVIILDSTTFDLCPELAATFKGYGGSASAAAMRLQFAFDYRTGHMHVEIGDVKLSDSGTLTRLIDSHAMPMDGICLFLTDLGYFKITNLEKIRNNPQHHILTKLQFGTKVTNPDGTDLNLLELLKGSPDEFDLNVKVGNLNCRLVGKKLPDAVVNAKIRKVNKSFDTKGKQITDKYRLFLHYALYITSLPIEYTMTQLFALYRIRWQVELTFKVWKSILCIHKIRSAKEDRVRCEVYGKLIVAALISCLCAAASAVLDGVVISFHKVARHVKVVASAWTVAVIGGLIDRFLKNLSRDLARFCKKTKSKHKKTIEQIIMQDVVIPLKGDKPQPVTP